MRNLIGRLRRPISRSQLTKALTLISEGDGSTLSLDFTAMSSLDSRFTFTRSSTTATFVNSSGLIATAGTNIPRFDHDPTTLAPRGLLIEGSATNLVNRSEDFGAADWLLDNSGATNPVVTVNHAAAPDGNTTADRIQFNKTGGTFSRIRNSFTSTGTSGATYTFSVWMRTTSGTGTANVGLRIGAETTGGNYVVTGTWQRFQRTIAVPSTDIIPQILLWDNIVGNDETADVLVWGAQLEAGSGASSYIPTGASTVQRAADDLQLTGSNFSSIWPSGLSEWSVYWSGDITRAPATTQFVWLTRAGGSSRTRGFVTTGSSIRSSNNIGDLTPGLSATVNTVFKMATGFKNADCFMWAHNGTTTASAAETSSGLQTDSDRLLFNVNADNFMHIRQFKFWQSRLSNGTLQGLVS